MTIDRIRRLSVLAKPVAIAAAAVGLGATLWAERTGIESYPWRFAWRPFVLAVATFSLGPLFGAVAFWLLLRDLCGAARFTATVRPWTRSFLARYVPSGVLTVVVRLHAGETIGATHRQMLSATVFEQVSAVIAGALTATAAFLVAGRAPSGVALGLLAGSLALALAIGRPRPGSFRARLLGPLSDRLPLPRSRSLALAALVDCCAWVTAGVATCILVDALSPNPPGHAFLVGAYALAWLLGFVAVFAPSGLGVREATLVVLLAPHFGVGAAAVLAVVLRLADTVADLVAASVVELGFAPRAGVRKTLQGWRRESDARAPHGGA